MLKATSTGARIFWVWLIAALAFAAILAVSVRLANCLAGTEANDIAAWVQAVGAILAIVVGFATILSQRALEQGDTAAARATNARAAHLVVTNAMTTLGERLDAVLAPGTSKHPYRLRGARTAEMISSLREFDTSRIPHEMLEKFLQLRANLHAINERISDVYESEKVSPTPRSKRWSELEGAIHIWENSRTLLGDVGLKLLEAGQTGLANAPATFAFENSPPPALTSARRKR